MSWAKVHQVPEEKINVVCEFLGGGYGGKSWSWPHTLQAAVAAKIVGRPVRLQLTRTQMYSMVGHQAATVQTIALGAGRDGKLAGIRHDSVNPTSTFDDYVEYAAMASRHLLGAGGGIDLKLVSNGALQPNTPYRIGIYAFDPDSTPLPQPRSAAPSKST